MIEIKHILKIKGKEITLTHEELLELRNEISKALPREYTWPVPFYDTTPQYLTTPILDSSTDTKFYTFQNDHNKTVTTGSN